MNIKSIISINKHKFLLPILFIMIMINVIRGSSSEATAIIAVRTNEGIFIGADSKSRDAATRPCKIIQSGTAFYAFSGSAVIKEGAQTFSVYEVLEKIFISETRMIQRPIEDKIAQFENIVRDSLTPVLEAKRGKEPINFCIEYFKNDKVALAAVIAGINNNVPILYGRKFRIVSQCKEPVILDVTPVNDNPILFGSSDPVVHPNERIVDYITRWIEQEIYARPKSVGQPIDILRITNNGAKWEQHKKECKEIQ